MDAEVRASVVAAFLDFLHRCTHGHEVLEVVAERLAVEAYLLGLMNTAYLSARDAPFTEAGLRAANPGSENSRFGDEHLDRLRAAGYASRVEEGWQLTKQGVEAVVELHRAVRSEVAHRRASPDLIAELNSRLARLMPDVSRSNKIRTIRHLWGAEEGIPVVDLYRNVWELWICRRELGDEEFYARWPTGDELRTLDRRFAVILADLR
jgi:hypothetical protein